MSQSSHEREARPPEQLLPQITELWELEVVPQLPTKLDEADYVILVNSANVQRFLARNIGIDQQDVGETAPHLV